MPEPVARYRLRVQLISWYELIVPADSAEDAVPNAEALSPRQIAARGKRVETETGLADPASVELIDDK
jgi:hypothetical protein